MNNLYKESKKKNFFFFSFFFCFLLGLGGGGMGGGGSKSSLVSDIFFTKNLNEKRGGAELEQLNFFTKDPNLKVFFNFTKNPN